MPGEVTCLQKNLWRQTNAYGFRVFEPPLANRLKIEDVFGVTHTLKLLPACLIFSHT
jgi:hypothetical protein